jgi:hypothetical protein
MEELFRKYINKLKRIDTDFVRSFIQEYILAELE